MHNITQHWKEPLGQVQEWELMAIRTKLGIWHKDTGSFLQAGEEEEYDLDGDRMMFYPFRCWTGCGSASIFYHVDLKRKNRKMSFEMEEINHLNPQLSGWSC